MLRSASAKTAACSALPFPPYGWSCTAQRAHARARGPLRSVQAAARCRAAWASDPRARLWLAAAAPRPTYCKRPSLRRAFSRSAVRPQRRLRSQAMDPMALLGSSHRIPLQWRCAPHCAMTVSSLCVAGEASPHAPNTSPRTGSKVRSMPSTGPTAPCSVPQYFRSTPRALAAYSAGNLFALRLTA